MDVTATRLRNLQALSERLQERLSQKEAAHELGISASYLSQLLAGKKMGDQVARKLEAAQGLPHGWMDQLHGDELRGLREDSPAYGSQQLRLDPDTISAALRLVRLAFYNLDLEIDQEENGLPLAFAYEYLVKRAERAVTPDNVIDFSKKLAERLGGQDAADKTPTRLARGTG